MNKVAIHAGSLLLRLSRVCIDAAETLFSAGYGSKAYNAGHVRASKEPALHHCRPRLADQPTSTEKLLMSSTAITAADIDLAYVRATARLAGWDGDAGELLLASGVAPTQAAAMFANAARQRPQ